MDNRDKPKRLTTAAGIPVDDNQTSLTAGEQGPTLLQDHHLLEKLAHFNRERIPERVVHAKAAGAFGMFTVIETSPEPSLVLVPRSCGLCRPSMALTVGTYVAPSPESE